VRGYGRGPPLQKKYASVDGFRAASVQFVEVSGQGSAGA